MDRFQRFIGNHIETIQMICYENQMAGFLMIFCKSSKSVCFIEDYGDFRDLRGACFSIFNFSESYQVYAHWVTQKCIQDCIRHFWYSFPAKVTNQSLNYRNKDLTAGKNFATSQLDVTNFSSESQSFSSASQFLNSFS